VGKQEDSLGKYMGYMGHVANSYIIWEKYGTNMRNVGNYKGYVPGI
jgi:hypothetical protein